MKQSHLIVYLESEGCKEVRFNPNHNYYIFRNLENGKESGVPQPKNNGDYREEVICRVCLSLGVNPPPLKEPELTQFISKINSQFNSN